MYGLPADTVRHKYTKKAAAPHPFWNEPPFTFKRVSREVSSLTELLLWRKEKVSLLERCPHFRKVHLQEGGCYGFIHL